MLVFRRIFADRRPGTHSQYWGRSKILGWISRGRNRLLEPIAAGLAAYALIPYDQQLTKLVGFGAFSLAFQYRVSALLMRQRKIAIGDAGIEAGDYS